MEENTPTPLPEMNPVVKAVSHVIIILGLYFMFGVLFSLAGRFIVEWTTGLIIKLDDTGIIADMENPEKINAYKILFLFISIGSFIATSLVYVKVFARQKISTYFGFKGIFPNPQIFLLVLVIAVSALPVISYISVLSRQILLPGDFGQEALNLQQTNDALSSKLIYADSILMLLFNLVVMAIVPAIGEELLFRGVFVQTFYRLFSNRIHLSVFVVAFLFSMVHMQVYNFIAIMFMGVLFGYMYYWSGNIMVSIWAHFFNNAFAVISAYLFSFYPDAVFLADDYQPNLLITLASAVILTGALVAFYRATRPNHAQTE